MAAVGETGAMWKRRAASTEPSEPFEHRRIVVGGVETTLGSLRLTAHYLARDETSPAIAQGLAWGLLAVLEEFERTLERSVDVGAHLERLEKPGGGGEAE